jgi:alpha-beta hydrolase superfamily lysophospholipase
MRGHGKTADLKVNDPGRGGLGGHCVDEDSGGRVTRDVDQINRRIRQERPGVPLFLLGHSWGSFISQNYIENYRGIDGIILSGSRGPDGLRVQIAPPVMRLLAGIRGCRKGSSIARAFADGPFNRPFRPNRTSFDWISRDEEEVDKYISDPLCGFLCSSGFYRDLAVLLSRIHRPELMEKIDRDMPVYIFSGSADPVGDMGNSPTALVNAYRSLGVKDLEFVLYPDARHETLNETNREEVAGNLLAWLLRHSGGQS